VKPETMMIDDVKYIREDAVSQKADTVNGLEYKIIRTYSAGVFAGYLEKRTGDEVVLKKACRLWYWDGAASLSQLAMEGVSKPKNCKFPCEVDEILLLGVVEVISATAKAKASIDGVKIWEK